MSGNVLLMDKNRNSMARARRVHPICHIRVLYNSSSELLLTAGFPCTFVGTLNQLVGPACVPAALGWPSSSWIVLDVHLLCLGSPKGLHPGQATVTHLLQLRSANSTSGHLVRPGKTVRMEALQLVGSRLLTKE